MVVQYATKIVRKNRRISIRLCAGIDNIANKVSFITIDYIRDYRLYRTTR